MGTIKSLFSEGENNNVECCWFYNVEETILKGNRGRNKAGTREVFLSTHTDVNAVESIAKKVTIKPEWEIDDLDAFIKQPDSFYYRKKYNHFDKCFEDVKII